MAVHGLTNTTHTQPSTNWAQTELAGEHLLFKHFTSWVGRKWTGLQKYDFKWIGNIKGPGESC